MPADQFPEFNRGERMPVDLASKDMIAHIHDRLSENRTDYMHSIAVTGMLQINFHKTLPGVIKATKQALFTFNLKWNINMKQYIYSIIMIAVGLVMIIWRGIIATMIIEDQNMLWNWGFGRTETKVSEYLCILFGFILIALGTLIMLGVIDFK